MDTLDVDFAALLTAFTALTGIVYGIDKLFFARAREARAQSIEASTATSADPEWAEAGARALRKEPVMVEYSRSFFPVLLIVLVLRSFIAEPFKIPSRSLMPTLLVGDFILVNKFAYGLRLPVTNTKILDVGQPKRGDIFVFHFPGSGPNDPKKGTYYIKRVIGLPGDEITYRDKTLYVNGAVVQTEDRGTYVGRGEGETMTGSNLKEEHLEGVDHQILLRREPNYYPSHEGTWKVGSGQYFAMGDNRDDSEDSRFWGMVPEANLVGRAWCIWFYWDSKNGYVDFSRIGTIIK